MSYSCTAGILSMSAALLLYAGCGISLNVRSLEPVTNVSPYESADGDSFWEDIEETVASPVASPANLKLDQFWFDGRMPEKGYWYTYGGKTACKVQPGTASKKAGILACYLDNRDYSGVTVALGDRQSINLQSLRSARAAGVAFRARGGKGGENIIVGLLDDATDGKKVQTRVALRDFGALDTAWQWFTIPLKRFQAKGKYWDESKKSEVLSDVDWGRINELRFSVNKAENGGYGDKPVRMYVEQAAIINDIPGYVDPEAFWASFSSNAPDMRLHDFEAAADQSWHTGTGPASEVGFEIVPAPVPLNNTKVLAINYRLNDWCDVMFDYRSSNAHTGRRDWTRFWGIRMTVYNEKAYQSFNVQISDAGNELYFASGGVPKGRTEILLPFKDFCKFPYYQPPEARHDGKLDLNGVVMLDIKPAGEGSEGTFFVDDILLTNGRAVSPDSVVEKVRLTVVGDCAETAGDTINESVFGINAQHWDSELMLPKTTEYVKEVRHPAVRFPGGLSADEYHWEQAFTSKDPTVTTDQFIQFCKRNGCEPMLTVNFGTGTAEEAAAWVKYVNITKKAGVRLWEIGNELYGSWHHNHCSAEIYGKRAAEFIRAMKQVDPTILVTVVWEIESPWNKTVFESTKDIADGVNVHNYPQESGEENDEALLASPQTLEAIISRVRKQLASYGISQKKYEIWLTEWNSVDFNPGPQSLGIVNALFVADYLCMLAKVNIEQASYWNIHNSMFEQGGDYGYLSRLDDPRGANIPRPSYWAFRMVREHIRGRFFGCATGDVNVTAYATVEKNGAKNLVLINKYSRTGIDAAIDVNGFMGTAEVKQLTADSGEKGYAVSKVVLAGKTEITLPAYSMTTLHIR